MGAFDHLEWTYNGAFEQLFGLRRGELEQMPGGLPEEGMFKLRFDWYIISTLVLSRSRCKSPGPGCSKPD